MARSTGEAVGRPTDVELTRRILDATIELLAEHGYPGLRIEHVAKLAGCGKNAVYRRFADKAELAAEALRSHAEVGEMPDHGNVADDLLEHVLQNQANQVRAASGETPVGDNGWRVAFDPEVFPILWERFFTHRRDQGIELILRGAARGELPADVDADLILDTFAGLTMFRQSIKGVSITPEQYRAMIAAVLASPPRGGDPT